MFAWLSPSRRAVAGSMLTGVCGQLFLIVSGVLAARILGAEQRGYLALLVLFPAILSQLGSLGLPQALTYYIAGDQARTAAIARSIFWPAILQVVVLTTIHGLIVAIFVWGRPDTVRVAGLLTLAAIPASFAQEYGLAILQGRRRFAAFNILRLLPAGIYASALSTVFILDIANLPMVTLVWVTANVAAGASVLSVTRRSLLPKVDGSHESGPSVPELLRFGFKGLFGSVSPLESFRLDQMLVGLFLSPTALGLYVVGLAFTNLPRFIGQSTGMVAYPHVAGQANERMARRSVWRFFWFTIGIGAVVVTVLEAAMGWLVLLFFGNDFSGAVPIARILLVGAIFLSVRRVLADGMKGTGYPGAGTIAEVASWFWLFLALAFFWPRMEVEDVALAVTSSSALSLCVLLGTAMLAGRPTLRRTAPLAEKAIHATDR